MRSQICSYYKKKYFTRIEWNSIVVTSLSSSTTFLYSRCITFSFIFNVHTMCTRFFRFFLFFLFYNQRDGIPFVNSTFAPS